MKIAVLIEPVPGNGFRAKGGEPLAMSAEGATRAEAIARLKTLIANRLTVGTELIDLELGSEEHPSLLYPAGPRTIRSWTSGSRRSWTIAAVLKTTRTVLVRAEGWRGRAGATSRVGPRTGGVALRSDPSHPAEFW